MTTTSPKAEVKSFVRILPSECVDPKFHGKPGTVLKIFNEEDTGDGIIPAEYVIGVVMGPNHVEVEHMFDDEFEVTTVPPTGTIVRPVRAA